MFKGHQKTTVQPFISLIMRQDFFSLKPVRFVMACDSQPPHLIIMQPSTPHQTIASFFVFGRQMISARLQRHLMGRGAAARRCRLSAALPRHGTRKPFRAWTQDTRIRCSRTFLLTWISHFGGHTLTCPFQSSQTQKRMSTNSVPPPPRFLNRR